METSLPSYLLCRSSWEVYHQGNLPTTTVAMEETFVVLMQMCKTPPPPILCILCSKASPSSPVPRAVEPLL